MLHSLPIPMGTGVGISYQQGFNSPVERCDSRAKYEAICNSPKVIEAEQQIRALKAEAEFAADPELKKSLSERADRLKRSLPVFMFMANFSGEKRCNEDAVLDGKVFIDYDGIDAPHDLLHQLFSAWGSKEEFCRFLGILLIKYSVSGRGFHVVAKAQEDVGGIVANQQWFDDNVFHLSHDKSCKDPARGTFATPMADHEWLSDELFTYSNPHFHELEMKARAGGSDSQQPAALSDSSALSDSVAALPAVSSAISSASLFHGHSYAEIQQLLWKKLGGEPAEGERHTKLLKMVSELRYICDNDPDFLLRVLVPLSHPLPTVEVEKIVRGACTYKVYNMQAPKALAAVLAELDINSAQEQEESYTADEANRQLHAEFYPRFQQLALSPFYRAVVSGVDEKLQMGMLLGSLPMTATMLTGIEFKHFDNKPSRLSTLFLAVGEAGSGKGNFETLDKILMQTLREQDEKYRKAEKEWTKLPQAEKEKRKKPDGQARIVPITISNSMLRQRLDEAAPKHLYTFETETATLLSSNAGGSWIKKNDIYCKAFHDEMCGADFANGASINGEIPVHYNFCITGTPVALDKFINEGNVLTGLPDRLLLYPLPDAHFQMLNQVAERTPEQVALMQLIAQKLCRVPDHTIVDAQPIVDALYRWCEEKTQQARDEQDLELDKFRKRSALIGERAAVQYAIIEHIDEFIATGHQLRVTQAAIDFGIFVADFALASQYMLFAAMVRKVTEQAQQRRRDLGVRIITNWDSILLSLPATFSPAEVHQRYPHISEDAVYKKLQRLVKKGVLTTIEYGLYGKAG